MLLNSSAADGAGAIAVKINTTSAWSTAGARYLWMGTNGVAKLSLAYPAVIKSEPGTNLQLITDSGQIIYFAPNGANYFYMEAGAFAATSDNQSTLGTTSNRFKTAFIGSGDALPTCDATTRGAFRTVFAGGGASDTFQVCMKAAADSYAFRTVFTAP